MDGLKKELAVLVRRPDNALCADCRLPGPTWASFNLGLFMCMACAGHHRSLGTHISKVRSITLDNWDAPSVALMGRVGNRTANSFWEARLPANSRERIHPAVDDNTKGAFIRAKYVNRQWYGQPASGADGGAASAQAEEPKALSKMEQRALRLAAREQQQQQPTPAAAVPRPAAAAAPAAVTAAPRAVANSDLFAGMAQPAAVAAAAVAVKAAVPQPQAPVRAQSASPWVSRAEHAAARAVELQQHQQMPQHHHNPPSAAAPVASAAATRSILDFSTDEPVSVSAARPSAAAVASSNVDDMFAGLSVTTGDTPSAQSQSQVPARIASAELLDFYAREPNSAPARAQHPVNSAAQPSADLFSVAEPATAGAVASAVSPFSFLSSSADEVESAAQPEADAAAGSAFDFLGGGDAGGDVAAYDATAAAPVAAPSRARAMADFSDLLEPAAAGASAPPPSLDAFNYAQSQPAAAPEGGYMTSVFPIPGVSYDMTAAVPSAAAPPMQYGAPNMGGFVNGMDNVQQPQQYGLGAGYAAQPVGLYPNSTLAPLPHSMSMPLPPVAAGMYGGAAALPADNPLSALSSLSNEQLAFGFAGAAPTSTLAPLPPFAGAFNNRPQVPQFTVQSVQASQQQQAQAAHARASDPFAHIAAAPSVSPPLSASPSHSPPGLHNRAPKGPNDCDVDGCDGRKVSRGLCSKHIRGPAASSPNSVPGPAASSHFAFLEPQPSAAMASLDPMSFLGSNAAPEPQASSSSFAFL